MKTLYARDYFPYAGVNLKPGQAFEARDIDAPLLIAIKRASSEPELSVARVAEIVAASQEVLQPSERSYSTAEMPRARGKRGPDKKPRKKRIYQRRDMQAEE